MLVTRITGVLCMLLLAACASTPQASRERDAAAKAFVTHPNAATIYVYRSPFNHLDANSTLYVDGRVIGSTLPGTYFRLDLVPGRHVLHGAGIDLGQFEIDARPGEIYFVSLAVIAGHSRFELIPDRIAREQIKACCALLENWSPGQRPLLR
ncbi:MAG TPA: DUF2846 domain-containing protein [Burkholderiales bacterium]|nr:DUF2846 domain-containing protein [Burkholderiales bacterium]